MCNNTSHCAPAKKRNRLVCIRLKRLGSIESHALMWVNFSSIISNDQQIVIGEHQPNAIIEHELYRWSTASNIGLSCVCAFYFLFVVYFVERERQTWILTQIAAPFMWATMNTTHETWLDMELLQLCSRAAIERYIAAFHYQSDPFSLSIKTSIWKFWQANFLIIYHIIF